jgi:hypothetical protein
MLESILVGLATFSTLFIIHLVIRHKSLKVKEVMVTQLYKHNLLKDFDREPIEIEEIDEEEDLEQGLRVIIDKDKAYWVVDNSFFTANIIDGDIDQESIEEIDALKLSHNEMEKLLNILDSLKE